MLKLFLLLTLMTASSASEKTTGIKQDSPVEFKEFDLQNGLHVIMHRDTANPIVSVDIWYLVGSKDEDPGHTGFAHLFEHMMFQGSKNVGKAEHFSYVQKAGGNVNGTTNTDRTNYFETLPSNQLELALWLESDRMMNLNVTQENFDNQREVVKEEKRQRYDNRPYGTWVINMFSRAFKEHPYQTPPIGSMEDLNRAGLSYAQDFYNRYYAPNNAVLIISGDIDYEETGILVDKYFGAIEPAEVKKKNYPQIIFNGGEVRDTIADNVQLPALYTGFRTRGMSSGDHYALDILSSILTEGKSSVLYKNIVYEKKLAKSVNSFVWDMELAGLFIINSTGYGHSDPKKIEDEIFAQIEHLKSEPVSGHILEKVKNTIENDFTQSRQTTLGKAELLAHYNVYLKNTGLINSDIENYLRVTPQELMEAAKKYLTRENCVVLFYLPKKAD
jgi:predicted Zn-dependent peptidase